MNEKLLNLMQNAPENHILPFFWQHGEDEATLRHYMQIIQEANIGAVCVESRPHPDYCGPKWWEDMDVIMDEARSRGMQVWILDDSHFPTGFANGAMHNEPLSKARRSVCCKKWTASGVLELTAQELQHPTEPQPSEIEKMVARAMQNMISKDPQTAFTDDALIALSAVSSDGQKLDLTGFATDAGLSYELPSGEWTIYQINTTRNRGPHPDYINMIDHDSCRVLIDAVYEPHWAHYKDDFGKTLAGFFSDEPELGNGHLYELHHEMGLGFDMDYPWSEELYQDLQEAYGENLPFELPLIWETEGDAAARAKARYTYMDKLTRLVEKNFSFQLGDWCRAHGVRYIGHLIEDNGQHCRTGSTLGHYFRGLAGQDMAGIDDIGGQVYPQGENDNYDMGAFQVRNGDFYHFMLGKLANSAAAIDPMKHGDAMCEIFGNYQWNEGVILEKYLADHFLVRGINYFVPHAFTPAPFPDPDCPPHFYAHGHNPQYRHFGQIMQYMNRVATLTSDGHHVSPVAVLYHGEAEWAGECMPSHFVGRKLAESQIEYDYLPSDVFDERDRFALTISDGELIVGPQHYKALVIPKSQFLTEAVALALDELQQAGVQVLFVEERPEGICNSEAVVDFANIPCVQLEEVVSQVTGLAEVSLSVPDTYIRTYHYVHTDGMEVWMFVNEGEEVYTGDIRFAAPVPNDIVEYDAWNNLFYAAPVSDNALQVEITPDKSRIFLAGYQGEVTLCEPVIAEGEEISLTSKTWKRSIVKSIDYPAFTDQKEVTIPDHLYAEQPDFSGYVRYENSFTAEPGKHYVLEITDAWEGVEVFLNGQSLGIQVVTPYIYDLTPALVKGTNEITIEVASTLEREMAKTPDRFGRPRTVTGFTGITGSVRLLVK